MLWHGLVLHPWIHILLMGEDHCRQDHDVAPEDTHLPYLVFDGLAKPLLYICVLIAYPVVTRL